MPKLQGKVAIVTGGSSGMGFAAAKRFVEEGAFVYIRGRRQAELDKAVSLIGRSVAAAQGEVSNLADLDRLYAKVSSEKGKIDILFAGRASLILSRSQRRQRRHQGGSPLLLPYVDCGVEGSAHPGQCDQSRPDRHANLRAAGAKQRGRRTSPRLVRRGRPVRAARPPG
jgi:hypothetical protein